MNFSKILVKLNFEINLFCYKHGSNVFTKLCLLETSILKLYNLH